MQTAEKFTITFFFKLLVLFVLLLTGVALKTTELTPPVEAKSTKPWQPSVVLDTDSQQMQQLYFRMVSSNTSASL